jgi:hypothetical protein
MGVDEQQLLRKNFVFNKVIYDEPELDELLHIVPESCFST